MWIALALCALGHAPALSPSVGPPSVVAASSGNLLVVRDVRVACPTTEAASGPHQVVIAHGAIVRIEPMDSAGPVPEAASVLDGRGRFLAPGFYDMHVHLPGVGSALPASFRRQALGMMLDSGITSARVARGHHGLLADKQAVERGDAKGPRLCLAAPALGSQSFPDADAAMQQFKVWKAQGFDAVKFLSGPPAGELHVYAGAAVATGLRWYGHLPKGDVSTWPLASMTSLEHASALVRMAERSPDTFDADLARLKSHGIFVCPDVDWYYANSDMPSLEALMAREGIGQLPHDVVHGWAESRRLPSPRRAGHAKAVRVFRELAPQLRAAGVELLISPSDAPFSVPGASYVLEAQHLSDAGYSAPEVFRMATLNAARCQGEESVRGSVTVGKIADLVLLEEDPFEDVAALGTVRCVLVAGRVVVGE